MRKYIAARSTRSLAAAAAGAALFSASPARAQQIDTNPPLPNVLLMIDNSGSMERMIDGTVPEATPGNACNCVENGGTATCDWTHRPVPNRWNGVQLALTGTLSNGFNCVAMSRAPGSTFATEYQIGGAAPYDTGYYLKFHRMVAKDQSNACVMAPGPLPGAPLTGGVGPQVNGSGAGGVATATGTIVPLTYGTFGTSAPPCNFAQNGDGAIQSMTALMRFAMMTFDQDPDQGIGVTPGASPTVLNPAFKGMWSYFPGWDSGAACTYLGSPVNCANLSMMAVGARNPAAPPWEGRMTYFQSDSDITKQQSNNQQVQQIIRGTRPYGATPIAGMFADAQYYFWSDPNGPQGMQGGDPFVSGGCRPEYIILLTDGAPNLDMQPDCSANPMGGTAGRCPFPLPQTTAATLYNNGARVGTNQFVKTYVIGFAVSAFQDQGVLEKCSMFAQNGSLAGKCDCSQTNLASIQPYGPCCQLQCIARNGGSQQAYFADTQGDLSNALTAILSDIAKNATTRTAPAFSSVVTNAVSDPNAPSTNESIFLASFNPSPGLPWSGDIQRQRYVCTYSGSGFTVPSPVVTNSAGDDFGVNLNSNQGPQRNFIAFQPDIEADGTTVDSSATIRPYVTSGVGDGLGKYSATTYSGQAPAVIGSVKPSALGPSIANGCPYTSTSTGTSATPPMQPALCTTMLLDYLFAQQSFPAQPSDFKFVSRYGNALGDIFHATPSVVAPPGSLLQDPLYVGFRQAWASRKQVVYAATNDGLLHAFWADETKLENNELWAMVPPAVMTNLYASYPASHLFLLDGSPIVKDVVWDRDASTTDPAVWHSMLVAGYGSSQRGYYAVDVTNPVATSLGNGVVPAEPPVPGPVLRWQLTSMPSSTFQVFGKQASATPAITTLFVDPGDGKGAREIGVAILPGGQDAAPPANVKACARATKTTDSAPPNDFTARSSVRCWSSSQNASDPINGRAVTIVRIDTGEVLRVFARAADVPSTDPLAIARRVTDTPLDSPMTGTPVVYPVDVGTDATKFFIGDADGTLWRFDLSSSDPSKWSGELYLDLYNTHVDTTATAWGDGQPFDITPVLSLDTAGEVVLNAATGSTQIYDTSGVDLIYSITEKVQGSPAKLRAQVNWWLGPPGSVGSQVLQPGERVSGPMTVFNGTFYFATYYAGATSSNACTSGVGRLWGRDFVAPSNTGDLSQGGIPELPPPPPNPPPVPLPVYVQPSDYDTTLLGKVIPGVSIKATPACASLGMAGTDQYVAGAQHQTPQNFAQGGYSLFSQVGTKGTGPSATRQLEMPVQTPTSPTVIDSWATVVE
jgi:type IV pilus assembly protein PilY1